MLRYIRRCSTHGSQTVRSLVSETILFPEKGQTSERRRTRLSPRTLPLGRDLLRNSAGALHMKWWQVTAHKILF